MACTHILRNQTQSIHITPLTTSVVASVGCCDGVLVGTGDGGFKGLGVGDVDGCGVGALVGCAIRVEYYSIQRQIIVRNNGLQTRVESSKSLHITYGIYFIHAGMT